MHRHKLKRISKFMLWLFALAALIATLPFVIGSGKYSNSVEVSNNSQFPLLKVRVTIGGAELDTFEVPAHGSIKVYSLAKPDGAIFVTGVWNDHLFSCEIGYTARGFRTDSWLNVEQVGLMKMVFQIRGEDFVSERKCDLN